MTYFFDCYLWSGGWLLLTNCRCVIWRCDSLPRWPENTTYLDLYRYKMIPNGFSWHIYRNIGSSFCRRKEPKIYHSPCVGTPCPWWSTCGTPSCSRWECPSCRRRCTGSAPGPRWCSVTCTGHERQTPRHRGRCHWWWGRSDRPSPARWTSRARWGSWSDRRRQEVRGGQRKPMDSM